MVTIISANHKNERSAGSRLPLDLQHHLQKWQRESGCLADRATCIYDMCMCFRVPSEVEVWQIALNMLVDNDTF
jgi:hypothetical protein